jgi:hypothetical protein
MSLRALFAKQSPGNQGRLFDNVLPYNGRLLRRDLDPPHNDLLMKKMKILNWLIALCGLWEFGDIVLPFIIGFGQVRSFVWNHILVGLILMLAGARAALTGNVRTARTMDWVAAVAGVWLILATFLLRDLTITAGLWNDLIVGAIVIIFGVWAALAPSRAGG